MINFNCLLEKGIITGEQLTSAIQTSAGKRELLRLLVAIKINSDSNVVTLGGEPVTLGGEPVTLN